MARRASDEELLAGALHTRIERWLELEGVFTIPGFGDVELADDLGLGAGRRPGAHLRRLNDSQVWRAGITVTARPAAPGDASAVMVSRRPWSSFSLPWGSATILRSGAM